jgi:CcmD family protein
MPALPLHEAGKYVAAAYIVLFALILIYVAIMAARLGRIERELGELLELTERDEPSAAGTTVGGEMPAGHEDTPDSLDVGRPQSTHA